MATPFSFQSLNFNNIPGRGIEANRRYTAGLEGMFKSIGEGTKDIAESYMSEEERKKREAEDKKKWDNMIAQQEYQKEQNRLNKEYQATRDAITDARYNNEWNVKQDERMMKEGALKNIKAQYGTMDTSNMTPEEQEYIKSIQFAPTYADAIAAQNSLNRYRYQQQMLKAQKEQNEANEKRTFAEDRPNRITRSTLSHLTDKQIDISGGYIPTSRKEAQRWLAEVNAALMAQNSITEDGVSEHSDFSSKVTSSLYSLQRQLQEFLGQTPNGY